MEELAKEIEKSYADHPIIVFCGKDALKTLEKLLRGMSFAKFRIGGSPENLEEIRSWQDGVLLLNSNEGVGLDTRFGRDALVLIGVAVETER